MEEGVVNGVVIVVAVVVVVMDVVVNLPTLTPLSALGLFDRASSLRRETCPNIPKGSSEDSNGLVADRGGGSLEERTCRLLILLLLLLLCFKGSERKCWMGALLDMSVLLRGRRTRME